MASFTSSEGDDLWNDYTDNVFFPSGTSDTLAINDWERMFEAFDKAIEERSWADDTGAYVISIQYMGYSQLGDITSSFGGGFL